ncbi:hypothetical protein [Kingella oralis]|uniref:hypothetical protein n=1 Tax=Kingella oralis TaxID=505 RepID=UPI0034E45FB0
MFYLFVFRQPEKQNRLDCAKRFLLDRLNFNRRVCSFAAHAAPTFRLPFNLA